MDIFFFCFLFEQFATTDAIVIVIVVVTSEVEATSIEVT